MKKPNNRLLSMCLFCLTLMVVSCQKEMDDYKKYIKGDPVITYTGKLDSVKVYPGQNRVLIKGLLVSDPKIVELKIYWNTRRDSLSIPIVRSGSVDTLKTYINNLAEGIYNFEFVTFDNLGNRSVRVFQSGRVYGNSYQLSLINRPLQTSVMRTYDHTLTTTYGNLDRNSGIFATELQYTDINGVVKYKRFPIEVSTGVLANVEEGTPLSYRSLYLPDTLSIDTFYTAYTNFKPATTIHYRNLGTPFTATNISGRWGTLENWTSNATANNIAGGRGSWDNNSGTGVLAAEAGWGTANIANGKIYQTQILTSGRYKIDVEFRRNNVTANVDATNNLVYFVATTNGAIPNVADVLTATKLGYYDLRWISDAYQTVSLEIQNPSKQAVTIGFVTNLTSSSNQYFNVRSMKITKIN